MRIFSVEEWVSQGDGIEFLYYRIKEIVGRSIDRKKRYYILWPGYYDSEAQANEAIKKGR